MMQMIRKQKMKLPPLKLPQAFWDKAAGLVAAGIMHNVATQRTADGSRIQTNAPSTRARKAKEGKPQLSLVDEKHRFVRSGKGSFKALRYIRHGGSGAILGVVVGPTTAELRELIRRVAALGYVGYIGLSANVKRALGVELRKAFQLLFAKARTGRGKR